MRWTPPCLAGAAVIALAAALHAQQPTRFVGRLAGGQPLTGAALADWHAPEANPRLDNQPLLNQDNPFRWLRDRSLRLPDTPEAFVETFTGDRLPGTVTAHERGPTESFDAQPPHFVVEPDVELKTPRPWFASSPVRVAEDAVRRIAWRKSSLDRYEPGTVFYRDGRTARFRAVRFGRNAAILLMDDGQTEARFDEIAELHFPQRDPWEAYFDELAALCPHAESRLIQVETNDGLIATVSRDRFFPMTEGGGDPQRWIHGLQPAWSLDLLWVPNPSIVMRRSFAPHEVPLSRLRPKVEDAASPLRGAGRHVAVNRNIEQGLLESGDQEYGWGFGTLGASELHFPLPECATGFQGRVGLDGVVRSGGAVQARIFFDGAESNPLWQSAPIVGASQTTDCGKISLPAGEGKPRTLVLQIDPLLQNAPAGADPLDIRDMADWLEPMLLLDPQKLQEALPPRTPQQIAAWRNWTTDDAAAPAIAWRNAFDLNAQFKSFQLAAANPDQPLRISRRFRPRSSDQWLIVLAEHAPGSKQRSKLEVRVEGELAAQWEIPPYTHDAAQRQPLVLSLAPFRREDDQPVTIDIVQSPTPKESPVLWRAAEVTRQAPTLFRLFEDEGDFAVADEAEATAVSLETSERHSGERSVKIAAPGRYTLPLPRQAAIRERPALGEFRFLRFAFRKTGKGRVAVLLHRQDENPQPIRYDAGTGEPSYGSAARVWSQELPERWIVMTCDLFKNFGNSDVTALTLEVPDGEHAFFDHVYLARAERDFDAIPAAPSPESTNQEARRELVKNVLDRTMPATVAIDFGGRWSTGVLLSAEGDVLTAGHAVVTPGKEATVVLRDGRRLKGKTLGVARDFDLGLVRIDEKGDWPTVAVGDARSIPTDGLYLGAAHPKKVVSEEAPAAHIVGVRRVLEGVIWTDFDLPDWSAGGPLFNKDGQLIGVQRGRSQFGGFLYTQLLDFPSVLSRMKNGEVWGAWPAGSGPMMGVHIETAPAGCRITEVYPDTPAAESGLRAGDWVVKIDDQPVRRLDDIYNHLAQRDPGQKTALEIRRGNETHSVTIPLIPRTP